MHESFICFAHILLKWMSLSRVWLFATPCTIQSMEFSRLEYWSGSLSLLQGIFPTQELNQGLLHRRWILYQLSHKGSPRILQWVAYPFSRGSSQPRNWTRVSCIAGGFFTNWAMREAQTGFELWLLYRQFSENFLCLSFLLCTVLKITMTTSRPR